MINKKRMIILGIILLTLIAIYVCLNFSAKSNKIQQQTANILDSDKNTITINSFRIFDILPKIVVKKGKKEIEYSNTFIESTKKFDQNLQLPKACTYKDTSNSEWENCILFGDFNGDNLIDVILAPEELQKIDGYNSYEYYYKDSALVYFQNNSGSFDIQKFEIEKTFNIDLASKGSHVAWSDEKTNINVEDKFKELLPSLTVSFFTKDNGKKYWELVLPYDAFSMNPIELQSLDVYYIWDKTKKEFVRFSEYRDLPEDYPD